MSGKHGYNPSKWKALCPLCNQHHPAIRRCNAMPRNVLAKEEPRLPVRPRDYDVPPSEQDFYEWAAIERGDGQREGEV